MKKSANYLPPLTVMLIVFAIIVTRDKEPESEGLATSPQVLGIDVVTEDSLARKKVEAMKSSQYDFSQLTMEKYDNPYRICTDPEIFNYINNDRYIKEFNSLLYTMRYVHGSLNFKSHFFVIVFPKSFIQKEMPEDISAQHILLHESDNAKASGQTADTLTVFSDGKIHPMLILHETARANLLVYNLPDVVMQGMSSLTVVLSELTAKYGEGKSLGDLVEMIHRNEVSSQSYEIIRSIPITTAGLEVPNGRPSLVGAFPFVHGSLVAHTLLQLFVHHYRSGRNIIEEFLQWRMQHLHATAQECLAQIKTYVPETFSNDLTLFRERVTPGFHAFFAVTPPRTELVGESNRLIITPFGFYRNHEGGILPSNYRINFGLGQMVGEIPEGMGNISMTEQLILRMQVIPIISDRHHAQTTLSQADYLRLKERIQPYQR